MKLSKFIADNSIKGFLAEDEGEALFKLAVDVAHLGPCLEVGSYCGKSSVYLGAACKQTQNILYAVDHHRGSEEHQLGEEYHDPDLYDKENHCVDTFPALRATLALAELENCVIPVVADSQIMVKHWTTPLSMVFIDGGHSIEAAKRDCMAWAKHIAAAGILAIHDIFEHPEDGGQGPYLAMQAVLNSGDFEMVGQVNSLGILRRKQ